MVSELKKQTVRAGIWSFLEALGQRSVQFVVGIILARILQPEQFGLIGMLMVFTAIAQTFLDSGFGAALIQKQTISKKDINSIFYFNIFAGIIIVCCLFVVSPWVANFYGHPVLSSLLRCLSLTIIINSFCLIQSVLLTKSLDFKIQAKVTLNASILSGIIGIFMAYKGYGVWSLAGQQLSYALFRMVLFWFYNSWRPAWVFSLESLREMYQFGSKMLASSLLNTFFDNVYLIVIGKLFSPAELGYYSRAQNLQRLPSRTLSSVVAKVTFPAFSTIQNDPARVKRGMKKALTFLVFVNFPLMIGLAITARPLVRVLLTAKWEPCTPYLQLLCFIGMLYPLQLVNLNVLKAMGKSNLFLRLEIYKKLITMSILIVTYRFGILVMIYGQIVASFLCYYLNTSYNKKLIDYSIVQQLRDIAPYLYVTLLMAIPVYSMNYFHFESQLFLLLNQVVIGTVTYLFFSYCFRLKAFTEVTGLLLPSWFAG